MSQIPRFVLSGVPNNAEGLAFIKQIRKHCNYARFQVKVRGNGPRAEAAKADGLRPTAYQFDLPLAKAATLRVYFEDKFEADLWRSHVQEVQRLREENGQLVRNVQDLQATQETLTRDAHLAYSRGYETMAKKVAAWIEGMPWLLRKALIHFYKEV